MSDLQVGLTFSSAEEAKRFVKEFCDAQWHPVRFSHSRTVASYNKMVSWVKHFELQYCQAPRCKWYDHVLVIKNLIENRAVKQLFMTYLTLNCIEFK